MIEIEILNKGFFKSDSIGYFPISTPTIYNMDNHTLNNQMLAFTNPTADDKSKISGYVMVSIQVQGPGDEAAQLKMGTDPKAAKKAPWMPSSVQKNYKQLYIKFIKGMHLPIMDIGGTIDAFVFINHLGNKIQTKVDTMDAESKTSVWNQEILIPLEMPISNDNLTFEVYDKDMMSTELVCTLKMSIKEILKTDSSKNAPDQPPNYEMKWINLYGCNPDCTNAEAKNQNENVDEATCFKGRILVEYYTIDAKHPECKIRDIDQKDEAYQNRLAKMKMKEYFIIFEIGTAICLPETENYKIRIALGEEYWETDTPKQGKD